MPKTSPKHTPEPIEEAVAKVCYYLSSLPVDKNLFARAVRGPWSVENACHWTLDVTFREDDSGDRERVLVANIAWLYRFTLLILKQHPDRRMSLIMRRSSCGWTEKFLREAIFAAITCHTVPEEGPLRPLRGTAELL